MSTDNGVPLRTAGEHGDKTEDTRNEKDDKRREQRLKNLEKAREAKKRKTEEKRRPTEDPPPKKDEQHTDSNDRGRSHNKHRRTPTPSPSRSRSRSRSASPSRSPSPKRDRKRRRSHSPKDRKNKRKRSSSPGKDNVPVPKDGFFSLISTTIFHGASDMFKLGVASGVVSLIYVLGSSAQAAISTRLGGNTQGNRAFGTAAKRTQSTAPVNGKMHPEWVQSQ